MIRFTTNINPSEKKIAIGLLPRGAAFRFSGSFNAKEDGIWIKTNGGDYDTIHGVDLKDGMIGHFNPSEQVVEINLQVDYEGDA